ncbi:hypothetical protein WOLCODRAFT_163561 [Wolfiporia cocos MD-104 SS10]|uniref:DUF6533 domain-containing protein n=1 Tax=Wolfiporia cocos (strain MD-104) TaxID=742152 RepID=A0A2H3JQH7_WOLCO|nr:hypothetical protein WOLCODRAFT_163561 [Wolfiporia cocos MD-104 SS10]
MSSPDTEPGSIAQHAAEVAQKQGQAIVIWTVGMFCIMGWEWIICLPQEIRLIWRHRPFNYISLFYALDRYYGLVQFAVVIPLLTDAFTVEDCPKIFRWQPVGAMLSTLISQTILGSRVYALYSQSKRVLMILAVVMAAEFAVEAYTLTVVFPAPSPAPGVIVPCVAIGPTPWLITFWSMPLVFDSLAFFLTLYKSVTYWRMDISTPMLTLLFRDGLIYFAMIFTMNLLNVILFTTMPPALQAINLPATLMLNIVMACRLVLNVRGSRPTITASRAGAGTGSGSTGLTRTADSTSYEMKKMNRPVHVLKTITSTVITTDSGQNDLVALPRGSESRDVEAASLAHETEAQDNGYGYSMKTREDW